MPRLGLPIAPAQGHVLMHRRADSHLSVRPRRRSPVVHFTPLSACRRHGHLCEGVVGQALLPVDVNEAPPLLVEGAVRVGAPARRDAPDVLPRAAAAAVLPPLVGPLEDEAADARAAGAHGAAPHDLLGQRPRRLGLRRLVLSADVGVVGVRAVLPEEEGLPRVGGELLDDVVEADASVDVDAPHVDVGQAVDGVGAGDLTVDGGHRTRPVVRLDDPGDVGHPGPGAPPAHAHVEPVVVPLVPDGPHQDGGVVLDSVHLRGHSAGGVAAVVVDAVQHPDSVRPERVEHEAVRDVRVRADGVDARLLHQGRVLLDVAAEVDPAAAPRDGIPSHAL
mmetsp:Transcript_73749/g.220068  ORF Transcript_73749/g.220068 Transcript_73749/m.220068 type:complete len:334 (-) Transcript_73749:23-1024(-)